VLPDGTLTVADAYNCRILFIHAHQIVRQLGRTGVCVHDPPRTFGAMNGDTPLKDGGVLISEIQGSWIDDVSRSGRLRWAVRAPVSYPSDPQMLSGGRILLADYANPGAAVIMNRHGRVLWRYRPTSGWGALNHPSLAMMLPNGDIAINDDYRDRVVVVDPRKNAIVWQYGHADYPGPASGYLSTPDGLDFVPLGPGNTPLWSRVHHP
jgi:outer membrane protein assembly factor BamB